MKNLQNAEFKQINHSLVISQALRECIKMSNYRIKDKFNCKIFKFYSA